MNLRTGLVAATAVLLAGAAAPRPSDLIASWPAPARAVAFVALGKYGPPDEVRPDRLVWRDRPPWREIVAHRDPAAPGRPGFLFESVDYEVPVRRWRELAAFDRGVDYDSVLDVLSARTADEASNVLALNLAVRIARGRLTGDEAARLFDRTLGLGPGRLSSRWTRRLLFRPRKTESSGL
jgi:hypothetical protein